MSKKKNKNEKSIFVVLGLILLLVVVIIYFSMKNDSSKKNEQSIKQVDNILSGEGGLIKEIITMGDGAEAKNGDMVSVHYTGYLEDGKVFDSSLTRNQPFEFSLGAGQVIKGWDLGVLGMKVGEKIKLTIPSDLAYGDNGIPGSIPAKATLIFEVELLAINK